MTEITGCLTTKEILVFLKNRYLKNQKKRLSISVLADATRINRSYLNKAFQGTVLLSQDQAFEIIQYFALLADEAEYFSLILDWEKSGNKGRKDFLKKKIDLFRKKSIDERKTLTPITQQTEIFSEYYLNPLHQFIHIGLSIPKYQLKPELLAVKLGIGPDQLKKTISELVHNNLIKKERNRYVIVKDFLHLKRSDPKNPYFQISHRNFVIKKILESQDGDHFSATMTISNEAKDKIRHYFNEFIQKCAEIVKTADSQELYQLNFDFFQVDSFFQFEGSI